MRTISRLTNSSSPLILDTSVAINLNASGYVNQILSAVVNSKIIVDIVLDELNLGANKGRVDADITGDLIALGSIKKVQLGEIGLREFEKMTIESEVGTLHDGEAATIAYALEVNGVAILDDFRAIKVCELIYTSLPLASSIDFFASEHVHNSLGLELVKKSIHNALMGARMRVPQKYQAWVIEVLGRETAVSCPSLPRSAFRNDL